MAATIKIKNSSTTGSVPTSGNLVQGELAVNVTDLGLYTENASGTVVKLNAPSIDDKNTGATKYLTIDTSGNIGVGVTPSAWTTYTNVLQTPSISLATNGAASVLGTNWYYDGQNRYKTTGYATLYVSTSGQHQFYTAASGTAGNILSSLTQAMTLDASGNLIVGGTTAVNSASGRGNITINGSSSAILNFTVGGTWYGHVYHDGTNLEMYNNRAGANIFYTNGSERARIDSSGNLLVGQTSVSQTANGVAIQYSGDASNLSRISVGGTGSGTGYSLYSGTAGAYRFYVSYAGQIYATSTSITAISDQTLKTNIRDLETGLTEVMALQPRRFDWVNGDATNVAGFIAQEVAEVLPELVDDYVYNTDENGNNITKKSLKMGDILPTLVKAIQELKTEFDAYKASHP